MEKTKNSKFHKVVKVSVIIPVYNVEQYLRECLNSAVNQTLQDIEIICVNDGSTDGSLNILKEYAANDSRIKIIDKPNSGYGDSMNKGIEAARGKLDLSLFSPKELNTLNLIIKNPVKYYRKTLNRLSLTEKIFSIRNEGRHKVLEVMGLKFKFKNKHRELLQKIEELDAILKTSVKSLALQNKKMEQDIGEVKSVVDDLVCRYSKSEENTQKILSKILKYACELNYRNVFIETISESKWLSKKSFTLILGSANYSFMFQLYNILNSIKPDTILEFGLGQTSLLTSQYANYFKKDLTIVDHNQEWIDEFSKKLELSDNIKIVRKDMIDFELNGVKTDKYASLDDIIQNKKFDFVIVDGPFGFDRVYPRTNILDLIPENLNHHFVIILDDVDRAGEQNTAKLIFEALEKNGIEYKKSYKHGLKSQLIISSMNYDFIHWY